MIPKLIPEWRAKAKNSSSISFIEQLLCARYMHIYPQCISQKTFKNGGQPPFYKKYDITIHILPRKKIMCFPNSYIKNGKNMQTDKKQHTQETVY